MESKPVTDIIDEVECKAQVIPLDNGAEKNNSEYKYLCALELNNLELLLQEWEG